MTVYCVIVEPLAVGATQVTFTPWFTGATVGLAGAAGGPDANVGRDPGGRHEHRRRYENESELPAVTSHRHTPVVRARVRTQPSHYGGLGHTVQYFPLLARDPCRRHGFPAAGALNGSAPAAVLPLRAAPALPVCGRSRHGRARSRALPIVTDSGPAGAETGDTTVTISADCPGGDLYCFSPASVTIPDGATVTWDNQSGTDHTVTCCDAASCDGASGGTGTDSGFSNGGVADGGSFSYTFNGPGTYVYYCAIHGFMHGTVTVTGAAPPEPTTAPPVATTPTTAPATTVTTTPASVGQAPAAPRCRRPLRSRPRVARHAVPIAVAVVLLGTGCLLVAASRRRRSVST